MANLEDTIPAFSMWKMFNETIIPGLLTMGYSENSVQILANIIKTKDFLNIFVYSRDSPVSHHQYEAMSKKYKSFTVWLLGRFFYVLNCEKLEKMHDLIMDAQWRILHHLSITQPHIYEELSMEYASALGQLNDYHKKEQKDLKTVLEIFVPYIDPDLKYKLDLTPLPVEITSRSTCANMQFKIIPFLGKIIHLNIELYYFNEVTSRILDSLLYIIAECSIELKLAALDVYVNLLQIKSSGMPEKFLEKYDRFIDYLEPFVYDVYNKKMDVNSLELQKFEDILTRFFNNLETDRLRIQNIAIFITFKNVNENLQEACCKMICAIQKSLFKQEGLIDECIKDFWVNQTANLLLIVEKQIILEMRRFLFYSNPIGDVLNLFEVNVSVTWNRLQEELKSNLRNNPCAKSCQFSTNLSLILQILQMLVRIKLELQNHLCVKRNTFGTTLLFFTEADILGFILTTIKNHADKCGYLESSNDVNELLQKILVIYPVTCLISDFEFTFLSVKYPLLKGGENFTKTCMYQNRGFTELVRSFVKYLEKQNFDQKQTAIRCSAFLHYVSFGFVNVESQREKIEKVQFMYKPCDYFDVYKVEDFVDSPELLKAALRYPPIFHHPTRWQEWKCNDIQIPLSYHPEYMSPTVIQVISETICMTGSDYVPVILWNSERKEIDYEIICLSCNKGFTDLKVLLQKYGESKKCIPAAFGIFGPTKKVANSKMFQADCNEFPRHVWLHTLLGLDNKQLKMELMKTLKAFCHVKQYYTQDMTRALLKFADDDDKEIRMQFVKVIFTFIQEAPNEYIEKLYEQCFRELKRITKKSLQYSNFDLQDTVLETIRQISFLPDDNIVLNVTELLLYFIMIPTSKYSLIACNIFNCMAYLHNTKTNGIYSLYKKQLSQIIVELCAINQALIDHNLSTSLEKISLVLGFFGPKEFVAQECRYLLPIFISLIIKMPKIEKLVHEIAYFLDMDLTELLITRYGNIFLYIFLNESDEGFKQAMIYVDKNTGVNGNTLRKRDLQVIIYELLLNFHDKRDRVILAIRILAREDSDSLTLSLTQIPEYLQPKLLGILAYFDMKLISPHADKKNVLLSLAQLLRFMGPKHITPLRFKILAMLRTALNLISETLRELNCDVWDAFVRSCETEALGPQLASIFVSLVPLMDYLPRKIYDIFEYLIIDNEGCMKDYIPDLFFFVETDVNNEISLIIKKHLKRIENMSFKNQLKWFLKYLNHETVEIRVHALKYLKRLFEKNRQELDQMILGYNGIDPTIVELLDILMYGCREKETALKLACGECIGELGAIEPSHLPRQYTQEEKFFVFFITEDTFIINALNELTRALQAEKNTQNMDRFALAIQEMLKVHGISPDVNSPKHNLWINFPEAQRELMLPLLSSRYTMVQPLEKITVSPIYGSKFGATFRTWIYNWTCNLILAVKRDRQSLLQVCLPSLKQDHRTMMNFLPHILLHALLESEDTHQNAYDEFMAIINSFNNKSKLNPLVNVKPSQPGSTLESIQSMTVEEQRDNQYTKVIFILLDFLDRWTREWIWEHGATGNENVQYQKIKTFLYQFCKLQLARCNYQCGEFPRALMYLEEYIQEQPNSLSNQFAFLSELYAQLDEPDGVVGVTALQDTEPPLEQRLLVLEISGKLADATACYERIHPPLKPHHLQGLVQCYLDLDNVNTALNFTEGAIQRQPEYKNILFEMQAEPLWRLCRFTELDTLLKKPELKTNTSWGVQMGQALLHLRNGERDEFKSVLDGLRLAQVKSLGAGSLEEGAYQHGYNHIAKLHAINELQQVERMVYELFARPNDHKVCESTVKKLTSEWELRFKVVQESIRIQEPMLCLRRVGLQQAKELLEERVPNSVPLLNSLLGESWLHSATIARAAGVHQQAYTYALKAEEYAPPRLFLEKARLHWLREEHEQALTSLKRGLELILPDTVTPKSSFDDLSLENRKIAAEAKLLIASYNDDIANVDTDVNIQNYKDALDMFKEWEKSFVCLAQYYDRVFQTYTDADKDDKGGDMQLYMIHYFSKSLLWGTRYVYQSMPRLLSIWFDCGTRLLNVTVPAIKEERTNTLFKMTRLIETFLERLPTYIFLTAFSQLVSRICHPQKTVYIELKSIIIKLILQYPQQTLWMMMSVIKSSYSVRSKRCAEILNDSQLKSTNMIKLISDFTKLAEKLIELCNKDIPDNVQTASINNLLRILPRMLTKPEFSEIMIPTQKFRKLVLPNPDFPSNQHNPFPNHYVHIVGIEDQITILQSLQHPRKITFRGSDGKLYVQMLKPKDDLRKDFRLMEFNDIVNQLLSREPESRQRRLNIRLYSVVPLNEECGLIEWIPDLIGLRLVLTKIYKQMGLNIRVRDLKQYFCNVRDTLVKKREMFTKGLIPKHPPVLAEWFRKTFPDAQGWLSARTAYIRTTAVISMVGYIVGLGDRHGENILFDSKCGDTMHVDFNCLFNKGETFEWPERVPFRLTHNMVAAMGPLGVEGVFRKSCACTLRVLRSNSKTLMSIVTPFVYDPLVSWHRNVGAGASTAERTNEQALDHIRDIELRLEGVVKSKNKSQSIPLSVEGQTNILIQDATSIDNLCQMYFGWGPYL